MAGYCARRSHGSRKPRCRRARRAGPPARQRRFSYSRNRQLTTATRTLFGNNPVPTFGIIGYLDRTHPRRAIRRHFFVNFRAVASCWDRKQATPSSIRLAVPGPQESLLMNLGRKAIMTEWNRAIPKSSIGGSAICKTGTPTIAHESLNNWGPPSSPSPPANLSHG